MKKLKIIFTSYLTSNFFFKFHLHSKKKFALLWRARRLLKGNDDFNFDPCLLCLWTNSFYLLFKISSRRLLFFKQIPTQQNLTMFLNKFPLTCFSRWLPFFKQIPTKSYYFEQIPFDMLFKIFSSWLPFFKREDHFKFEFEMMLSSASI